MDKPDRTALQLITVDDPRFTAMLDRRIGEMRHLLNAMKPTSPATALRTLRDAFPEAPLDEWVRAVVTARH